MAANLTEYWTLKENFGYLPKNLQRSLSDVAAELYRNYLFHLLNYLAVPTSLKIPQFDVNCSVCCGV